MHMEEEIMTRHDRISSQDCIHWKGLYKEELTWSDVSIVKTEEACHDQSVQNSSKALIISDLRSTRSVLIRSCPLGSVLWNLTQSSVGCCRRLPQAFS